MEELLKITRPRWR